MKLTDRRLTISLSEEQYNLVKRMAIENYEGRFSQAIRTIIQFYLSHEKRNTK